MPEKVIQAEPGVDVVIVAPSGHRFETPGWRNANHTRHRLPGAVLPNPAHGHPVPPPDPEPEPEPEPPTGERFLLMPRSELMALPTSGVAWNAMVAQASAAGAVDLSNQDERNDVRLLAAALMAVRTGGDTQEIANRLRAVPGTELGGRTLALGRNLLSVVLAADLIGFREPGFTRWLDLVRRQPLDGRTLISTHDDRPNNWGTHAGASRIAADLYLGDTTDLILAVRTFRGWLGDRSQYARFKWTAPMTWHANPALPVGINPRDSVIEGHDVDGVLPDDQRRAGGFSWPPAKENYVYEALQGALMQAELLHQAGYPAYEWSDRAIGRAFRWLDEVCDFPAAGDDTWQPHLVNARCDEDLPAPVPSQIGKNFGYADWLYGGGS